MQISVIYFAAVRDLVGLSEETVDWDGAPATVGAFSQHLLARHPRLHLDGVRLAVNEEFAEDATVLCAHDVVALIPPVSGG